MLVPPSPGQKAASPDGVRFVGTRTIAVLPILVGVLACGSGGAHSATPKPNWSVSLGAAKQARRIETVFREGSSLDRAAKEGAILKFIERFPEDPNCVTMQLRLAWIRLYQMRLEEARSILTATGLPAASVDRDYATILRGALLRREGKATLALELLLTLDGKLVDALLRDLWCEEALQAALDVSRWGTAIYLMTVWRATGSDERMPSTEAQIEAGLAKVPAARLGRLLVELSAQSRLPVAEANVRQARSFVLESLRARMGFEALSRKDPEMARNSLNNAPTKFLRSSTGEELRRLSETAISQAHAVQASIGLLLEMQDDVASRRSAELVTGAMRALDETQSLSQIRLISREVRAKDESEISTGLNSLVADGAAIVIAGVTTATHAAAAKLCISEPTVVISLSGGADEKPSARFFRVEDANAATLRMLAKKGESSPLSVESDSAWCATTSGGLSDGTEKLVESRPLFIAYDECARRVATRLREGSRAESVFLGPEAVGVRDRFERVTLLTSPRLASHQRTDAAIAWQSRFHRDPYWYEALGYDVVKLSAQALHIIGSDVVSGNMAVLALAQKLTAELEHAQSELMTSSSRGFDAHHLLSPTIEAIPEIPASGPKGSP